MKTNIINIKHLCALLLTALAFAACSSDADDIVNQPEPQQPAADGIHFTAAKYNEWAEFLRTYPYARNAVGSD